jgi:hypothetical protein
VEGVCSRAVNPQKNKMSGPEMFELVEIKGKFVML